MAARRYTVAEVAPVVTEALGRLEAWLAAHPAAAQSTPPANGARSGDADVQHQVGDAQARSTDAESADDLVAVLIDVVVLSDDLGRAHPLESPPVMGAEALRIVVRSLLDLLAARAPGRSVEVRVPPFAAVQCVEGPRHTRGTPANVIETDAWTWIRLATGQLVWSDARESHAVTVSGARADLAPLLPLL